MSKLGNPKRVFAAIVAGAAGFGAALGVAACGEERSGEVEIQRPPAAPGTTGTTGTTGTGTTGTGTGTTGTGTTGTPPGG